jgi:hypothetical protein
MSRLYVHNPAAPQAAPIKQVFFYTHFSSSSGEPSTNKDALEDEAGDDGQKGAQTTALSNYIRSSKQKIGSMIGENFEQPNKLTKEQLEKIRLLGVFMMAKLGDKYFMYCSTGEISSVVKEHKHADNWIDVARQIDEAEKIQNDNGNGGEVDGLDLSGVGDDDVEVTADMN